MTATGIALDGADAGKYQLSSDMAMTTADITKAPAMIKLDPVLAHTYTGDPLRPSATPFPEYLRLIWVGVPQSQVGNWPFSVEVDDPNYEGSAHGTYTIFAARQTTLILSANPATLTSGGTSTLTVTGGSTGGTVTFAAHGTPGLSCTINGNTLTAVGETGSCTVTATMAGDNNYSAVDSSPLAVSVSADATAARIMDGPNGPIYATAKGADGTLYLGGNFSYWGPLTGGGALLGATDNAVNRYYPPVDGLVTAVAADGQGGWYLGGNFASVGGLPRQNLAHITSAGQVDPNWHPDANSSVTALAVSGSTVYVGGGFSSIGGVTRHYLAAIQADGSLIDWNPNPNNWVSALAVDGSTVYAGGLFTTVGGQTRNRVAAIGDDGTLLSWNPGANGEVRALGVLGLNVFAGGTFTTFGGQPRNRLSAVGTNGTLAPWNPNVTFGSSVYALAVTESAVYVAGDFYSIGGQSRSNLAALGPVDGSVLSWNPGPSGSVSALAVSGSTLYVAGDYSSIGGENRTGLAAFDANGALTGWHPVMASPGGGDTGCVRALAVAGSSVYAGGCFTTGGGGETRNNLAAIAPDGALKSWNPNLNGGVYALAISGSTVYAGGRFTGSADPMSFGSGPSHLAAIDGEFGGVLPLSASPNDGVNALAVAGSTLYVGGEFTAVGASGPGMPGMGGETRNHLAAYEIQGMMLSSWNPDADGAVQTLATGGSTVYAGGNFSSLGGQPRGRLAAIGSDGAPTGWNPEADGPVRTLAVSGSTVYVGGNFTTMGGQTRQGLAAVDADGTVQAWNPGAEGGSVNALAVSGSTVYAGGAFSSVAGQLRPRLAAIGTDSHLSDWNPDAGAASFAQASYVQSLLVSDSTVVAGGSFATVVNELKPGSPLTNLAFLNISADLPSLTASVTIDSKTWDGTPNATIIACALDGIMGTDQVACDFSDAIAVFADATIGTGKTVNATGLKLGGADAAKYRFDGNATGTADILAVQTPTVLTPSASSVTYGQSVTLTVTVTGAKPTGNVTFHDGGTVLGTKPLRNGVATLAKVLSAGAHSLTADYAGDANNPASTSQPVTLDVAKADQAPLLLSANPASLLVGGKATLTATGGTGAGTLSYDIVSQTGVTCAINGRVLTTAIGPNGGQCVVKATKTPKNANYNPVNSAPLVLDVTAPPVTIGLTAASASITYPARAALTVTVTGVSPTGTVGLYDGASLLTTKPLPRSGVLNLAIALAPGSHGLTARYSGDANNAAIDSAEAAIEVAKAAQAPLTAVATPNPLPLGKVATLSRTGGSGTGALTYQATGAGGAICTVTANKLKATGGAGACEVTVTKAASTNYLEASSAPLNVTVTP